MKTEWRKIALRYSMNWHNRWWVFWHLVVRGEVLTFSYWKYGGNDDKTCIGIDHLRGDE